MRLLSVAAVALAGAGLAAVSACSPPTSSTSTSTSSGGGVSAAGATSAQALGGMDALVAAANKEGTLNVIALPPDWANYGAIINAFKAEVPADQGQRPPSPTRAARTRSTRRTR